MKINFFSLHIGDFLGGVLHMDAQEVGAYTMLVVAHYQIGEQGLPDDDKKLARIARCGLKQWLRIKPTVLEKFTLTNGFWCNSNVIDAIRQMQVKSADAKAKSLKRWEGTDAAALPEQSHGNPSHKPEAISQEEERIKTTPTECEKKKEEAPPDGSAPAPAKLPRATRLEAFLEREGTELTARAWGDWAFETLAFTPDEISWNMKKMRDWAKSQSGGKGVKADWFATWRNWCRRVHEENKRKEELNGLYANKRGR